MNCVILQPSYIPWRGYFHQIQKADVFVFYDDVQYDAHGWRNRNKIKTPTDSRWLTIPVRHAGLRAFHDNCTEDTPMHAVETVVSAKWHRKHFENIRQNYNQAPFFKDYLPLLKSWYAEPARLLTDLTIRQTIDIAKELGVTKTQFIRSSTLGFDGVKTNRLLKILHHLGATHYICGPSANVYLSEAELNAEGITLEWMKYDYPEYPQLHGPFDPNLSILDLLFMTGPDAPRYIWDRESATVEPPSGALLESVGSAL